MNKKQNRLIVNNNGLVKDVKIIAKTKDNI